MALTILNNIYSLDAQNALLKSSNTQGKILERLSTGLRINNASDDPSGLAISEKLRGQISGLKRAGMNAQDGISYLQTAEGAIGSVTSMLQRMREIAVQAGNGIYTTNDRAVLQLEVDQLKEEINRISRSAEFNTKKLLDGSGTALWSSTSDDISAIIRGPQVAEGNYKIEASLNAGSNSKYKTNIMAVKDGVLVAEVTSAIGTPNLEAVIEPFNLDVTGTDYLVFRVDSGGATRDAANVTAATISNKKLFQQDGSNWTVASATISTGVTASGYFEVEILESRKVSGNLSFRYRVLDSKTGKLTNWVTTATSTNAGTAVITINGVNQSTAPNTASGVITLTMPVNADIKAGDKIFSSFSKIKNGNTDVAISGGGTIIISGGASIDYSAVGSLTKAKNDNGKIDYNDVTVHMGKLDAKTGVVEYGHLTLQFAERDSDAPAADQTPGVGTTKPGEVKVNIRDSGPATKDTRLYDLKQFTNADGVNILETTQTLTIYANGKQAIINLEIDDTIEDFENKLTSALVDKLNLGADEKTEDGKEVNANLVNYVPRLHEVDGTSESVPGTFIIQTAKFGIDSELVFIGDQDLINALGIAQIQKGANSTMDVKVTDAHTGRYIGGDNIGDGRLRDVIDGVEVVVSQTIGVDMTWDSAARSIKFSTDATASSENYLHIVDNRTELQIGANQGQTINISVSQLDTTGLEIDDVYVLDMDLAQVAITKLDKAIDMLNASRATIGAQVSRLEYAISNLNTTRINLTSADSRIRDLDMAEATSQLSQYQVLVQAGAAMVAQANQYPQYALTLLKG